jgi:hypothetical protein
VEFEDKLDMYMEPTWVFCLVLLLLGLFTLHGVHKTTKPWAFFQPHGFEKNPSSEEEDHDFPSASVGSSSISRWSTLKSKPCKNSETQHSGSVTPGFGRRGKEFALIL